MTQDKTTETPQALFRAAAQLIALGLEQLDTRVLRIDAGRRVFVTYSDAKAFERLQHIPPKLLRYADQLDSAHKQREETAMRHRDAIEQEPKNETK